MTKKELIEESKDERIRKALIKFHKSTIDVDGIKGEDIIAWLEKQGRLMKALQISNSRIAELVEEKYNLEEKLEKQSEQKFALPKWKYKNDNTPLLRDSLILNKYGCVAKSPSGALVSDVWVMDYDELTKLPKEEIEKQIENNMGISEATKKKLEDNLNKALEKETLESWNEFLEEQGEQKVEPKFKVGDWVITNKKHIWYVAETPETTSYLYRLINQYGKVEVAEFEAVDEKARLWTIQDAKDGDVLCYKDEISLYKHDIKNCTKQETTFGGFVYYCCYDGKRFITDSLYSLTEQDKMDIHPSTKEQRDTLEKAMTDAGWKFDFDKKELKKIDNEIEIPFGVKDSELQEVTYYIPKGFHAEIDGDKVVIKKGEKPTAWSEGDERIYSSIMYSFVHNFPLTIQQQEFVKSLKKRVQVQNLIFTDEELAQGKKDAYNDALGKIEYHSGTPTFDDGWSAAIDYIRKKSI